MKPILFLFIGLSAGIHLFAQGKQSLIVKNGADLSKAVPVIERYAYPDFRSGSVTYVNGQVASAKLNYQLLLGEVQFLGSKGDTLSLADELTIKQISIGEDLFFYDHKNGYLEIIADYGLVKLAIKQVLQQGGRRKQAAYDQTSGTSAINNYKMYRDENGSLQHLNSKSDVILSREVSYFFMDRNNHFHLANKSNTLKVFAKYKEALGQYLKEKPIDFHKKEDLERLYQFCSQL